MLLFSLPTRFLWLWIQNVMKLAHVCVLFIILTIVENALFIGPSSNYTLVKTFKYGPDSYQCSTIS